MRSPQKLCRFAASARTSNLLGAPATRLSGTQSKEGVVKLTKAALYFSTFIALAQQRFESGDLKGFTKSSTEHIIEQLDDQVTVRSLEGTVVSKSLAQPLAGVLVEVRGPGLSERVRSERERRSPEAC
jgi:hypothetical protein